jgi:hypothetical protein
MERNAAVLPNLRNAFGQNTNVVSPLIDFDSGALACAIVCAHGLLNWKQNPRS